MTTAKSDDQEREESQPNTTKVPVTKANVIFECGLFIGRFGRRRVVQVVEPKVDWPSDLAGVTNIKIPRVEGADCATVAKAVAVELVKAWGKRPLALASVGLAHAVRTLESEGPAAHEAILLAKDQRGSEPIVIDSEVIRSAYKDALVRVDRRFWTTSYLKSNFWNESRSEMMQANLDLTKRLSADKSLRRLFLVPHPEQEFLDDQRFAFEAMCQRGRTNQAKQELERLKSFRDDMKRLSDAGFEMQVVHARQSDAWNLIGTRAGRPYPQHDTEIAIYDEWRVDCFSGAQGGGIDGVSIFLPYMQRFPGVASAATHYFEAVWPQDNSSELQNFLDRLIAALEEVVERIIHTPDFTFLFDGANGTLKDAELEIVIDAIEANGFAKTCRRYLDIGTCTGRYPLALRTRLASDVEINAIDSDWYCYHHTRAKFRDAGLDLNSVIWKDFLSWSENRDAQYDLITCMLGTISYFTARKPDGVARAIARMAALLRPGGILIMGSWSELEIRGKSFLEGYSPAAREQLAEYTPADNVLESALRDCGLTLRPSRRALDKIDVYVAEKL